MLHLPNLKQACEASNRLRSGVLTESVLAEIGATPEAWVRFYRRPTEVVDALIRIVFCKSRREFNRVIDKVAAQLDRTPASVLGQAWQDGGLDGIAKAVPEIDDALYDMVQAVSQFQKKVVEQPEDIGQGFEAVGLFISSVFNPCRVAHGMQIWKLYRTAYAGKGPQAIEALDKLIRLDKRVISDPQIHKVWFNCSQGADSSLARRFQKAVAGGPPELTPKRLKVYAAAMVWLAADQCKHRLTTPDLRDLFNAMSLEFDGQPIDKDLAGDDGALQKAIKREKNRILEVSGQTHLMPNHSKS